MFRQLTPMAFDPVYGISCPVPKFPEDYRKYHGEIPWLFNPWTGERRDPIDISIDILGYLIDCPK